MGYYGAQHYGAPHYASRYFRPAETEECGAYYAGRYYWPDFFNGGYYSHCSGYVQPEPEPEPPPAPTGYYSPGLGGELFPKRKEPRRPRVRAPSPRRAEPRPVSAVLIAVTPAVVRTVLLAPDAANAVALVLEGGLWREPKQETERMVFVGGMWREITKRTSWQYEIDGKWVNYE